MRINNKGTGGDNPRHTVGSGCRRGRGGGGVRQQHDELTGLVLGGRRIHPFRAQRLVL